MLSRHPVLFRAKRLDNGEWIQGGILHQTDFYGSEVDRYYIIDGESTNDYDIGDAYRVDPATISECIFWKDRYDTMIFENDIVQFTIHGGRTETFLIWYCNEGAERQALDIDTLEYFGDEFHDCTGVPWSEFMLRLCDPWDDFVDIKVLGNVFDDPEYVKRAIDEYNTWLKR